MRNCIYFFIISSCLATASFGQAIQPEKKPWPVMKNSPDYYEVRDQYLAQLNDLEITSSLFGLDLDGDDMLAKYMRWDYLMKTRVDSAGNYPDPAILFKETAKYNQSHDNANAGSRAADWMPVGTAEIPGSGGGVGRVNVLIFDPIDHNTLYAGTAGGGLWRSPDGGGIWVPITDNIPVTSIADLVVNPVNNDIIYIATGDGYGYEADFQSDNDFWGGVYSAGILKSTDGGATWLPTGLSYQQDELQIVQKIMMHPDNPNILVAATRNGIYRTTNAGDTWSLVESRHCYDFAYNTGNHNTFYSVGDKDVIVSYDGGATWSLLENNLASSDDRMSIETTEDDPDIIYVFSISEDMWVSTDAGTSWDALSSPGDVTSFYGYYDQVLEVSDLNSDLVFTGGLEIARSTNGGNSWSKKSTWDAWPDADYAHADQKVILCDPLDENIVYAGNDGGIFKSTDKGNSWTDISSGLRIAQIYRLSVAQTAPDMVLSGWQDNGSNLWNGTDWDRVMGGDGMDVTIDYTNEDRMYAEYYNGDMYRSLNGGISWTPMSVAGGGWLTPFEMDPVDHLVMYYGTASGNIQKTTNGGTSWTTKTAGLGAEVFDIIVAPSNTDYVYACALESIKRSTNGGDTWTNITGTLPHSGIGFNYIAVSDDDPEKVWVALSGYDDGNKVFYSDDAGASWTNISGTLPNVPINTIVYENISANNRIYIGTDIGVFTKSDLDADWEPYMTGLPNVMVHELEISNSDYKIYAATYGRGIWSSSLYDFIPPSINITVIDPVYCPGQALNVSYAATGTIFTDNVYSCQLSDATGSFASPVVIGTLATDALTGVISCVIPVSTPIGAGYRMRVVSSDPVFAGTDNGFDIAVACGIPYGLNHLAVTTSSATLEWAGATCAISYEIQYKPVSETTWLFTTSTDPTVSVTGLIPNTLYEWEVNSICVSGAPDVISGYSSTDEFTTAQNGIEETIGLNGLSIYPNPFSTSSTIQLTLDHSATIKIELLDVTGRIVKIINEGELSPGISTFEIKRDNLAGGVYTLQFTNEDKSIAKPLVVE